MKVKFSIRKVDLRRFLSGAQVMVVPVDREDSIELSLDPSKFIFKPSQGPVWVRKTKLRERISFKLNKRRWMK